MSHIFVHDCPICLPPLRDREGRGRAEQLATPCACGKRLGQHYSGHPHCCPNSLDKPGYYIPQSAFQALAGVTS